MKDRIQTKPWKRAVSLLLIMAMLSCTLVQDGLTPPRGGRTTAGITESDKLEQLYMELNEKSEPVPAGWQTENGRLSEMLEEESASLIEAFADGKPETGSAEAAAFREVLTLARQSAETEIEETSRMECMESPVLQERLKQWQEAMEEEFSRLEENLERVEESGDMDALQALKEQLAAEKKEETWSVLPALPAPAYEAGSATFNGMPEKTDDGAVPFAPEELLSVPESLKEELAANPETAGLSSALEIYNYVKTQITFEPYYGARKGAAGTLAQKSGNDCDQAALLTALLRANGIPAYYVRGNVTFRAEQVLSWTAAEDIRSAVRWLAAQGIPLTTLHAGGEICAVRMERVWVKALVPYGNYRGAGENTGEKIWIPLDAAFKKSVRHDGTDIGELFGTEEMFDELAEWGDYTTAGDYGISRVNAEELLLASEDAEERLEAYAQENGLSDASPAEMFGGKELAEEALSLLPSSLPGVVTEILDEYQEIPQKLTAEISISLSDASPQGLTALAGEAFSCTLPVPELENRRLILSWAPAGKEDAEVLAAYGSIFRTPSYLLKMKPQLWLDGNLIAEGGGCTPGFVQELTIRVHAPGMKEDCIKNTLTAGGMYGILLDSGRISPGELEGIKDRLDGLKDTLTESNMYEEAAMGELLNAAGKAYFAQLDLYHPVLEGQTGVDMVRALSVGIAAYQPDVRYLFFSPVEFKEGSLYLDIDLDAVSVVSNRIDQREREKEFLLQTGIFGSALEHRVLEQMTGVESVSTIKILETANRQGIPICMVTEGNADEVIGLLSVSDGVKENVRHAVDEGNIVILPQTDVRVYDWSGAGYLVLDPETGAGSYLIEGGLSGGTMTTAVLLMHYLEYVRNGIAAMVLTSVLKGTLMALFGGTFTYALMFGAGVYFGVQTVRNISDLWQEYGKTNARYFWGEITAQVMAMALVGYIRFGPSKVVFESLETYSYAHSYLLNTGAGEEVCNAFVRTYGLGNLVEAKRIIGYFQKAGLANGQLLMVAEEFNIRYVAVMETAYAKIGVVSAEEANFIGIIFKQAGTAAEMETLGTGLALMRQSGIALSEAGKYGAWNAGGVLSLTEALENGILPETISALCEVGVYPGSYKWLGIDTESKAQEFVEKAQSEMNFQIRTVDYDLDASLIARVKELRQSLTGKLKSKGNMGYCELIIDMLSDREIYAHSGIKNYEQIANKEFAEKLSDISREYSYEESFFKPLKVNSQNEVDGVDAWLRNVDSEHKMLETIARLLEDNMDVRGTIKLYTELPPCPSCINVIKQFEVRYPNVEIIVIHNNGIILK